MKIFTLSYIRVLVSRYSVVGPDCNWTLVSGVALMKEFIFSPRAGLISHSQYSNISLNLCLHFCCCPSGGKSAGPGNLAWQCRPCSCVHVDPWKGFPGCSGQRLLVVSPLLEGSKGWRLLVEGQRIPWWARWWKGCCEGSGAGAQPTLIYAPVQEDTNRWTLKGSQDLLISFWVISWCAGEKETGEYNVF